MELKKLVEFCADNNFTGSVLIRDTNTIFSFVPKNGGSSYHREINNSEILNNQDVLAKVIDSINSTKEVT